MANIKGKNLFTGRLETDSISSSSYSVTFLDLNTSVKETAHCDDGSDDRISHPRLANNAIFKGVVRMTENSSVSIFVALK